MRLDPARGRRDNQPPFTGLAAHRRSGQVGDRDGVPVAVRRALVIGTAGLFAGRALLSLARTGPVLVADEAGYLTNARVLAGGLAGQLQDAPFYRGGYSLLISPLVDVAANPETAYRLILIANAALAASLLPLLYVLLTRCAAISPSSALTAALAGASYPAVTVLSQVAMSENLLFPLTCIWLLAAATMLQSERPSTVWAAALGLATAALWAVHGRMLVAVVLATGGMVVLTLRRRVAPAALLAFAVVLGSGIWATHRLDDDLRERSYGGHRTGEASGRLSALLHPHGLVTAAENLLGQTFYLGAATFGLGAVACVYLRARPLFAVLAALTGSLLTVSAGAFADRTRPDMLIYGRYTEIVAPPLIAVGVALLTGRSASDWKRFGAPAAVLTAAVVVVRALSSAPGSANRWNVSALPFVTRDLDPLVLGGAALVAVAGALLVARPGARAWTVTALLLGVTAYGAWNPVLRSERDVYPSGWTSPQAALDAAGARTVGYDITHDDVISRYVLQWYMPQTTMRTFDGSRQRPPSRFVLSGVSWPNEHSRLTAVALWRDPGRDSVLWRLGARARG